MSLARRLAVLVALLALLLVLGTTELTLVWSSRSRLEDLRRESVALAETWAAYLGRVAPHGDTALVAAAMDRWPDQVLTATTAAVFSSTRSGLVLTATSDSSFRIEPAPQDRGALSRGIMAVWRDETPRPAWRVAVPLGQDKPWGVLSVEVSVETLEAWASNERKRAYPAAGAAALLLSLGVGVLMTHWVGRPLGALDASMVRAHEGMEPAPAAPESGAVEFRRLARRYNDLQTALAGRRREAAAQASRLALEERSRGLERLALAEETAAAFAHEIGTPLNVVSGHLQLLRDDLLRSGQGDGTDRVKTVLAQVDRVSAIVRARLDRGAWPAQNLREADLAELASRLASFMEPSLRQSGVNLEEKLLPARSRCDPVLVEQILLNLMKNAIEAMPDGGQLRLETGSDRQHSWLQVADDGPGLSPEAQARLFQPFATTKGAAGTGLGLAVSQRLAGAMGGSLEFLPGGRGTTWKLSLPGVTA